MSNIENRNLVQLKKYVAFDKDNFPDDRAHILDWAIAEIERLREDCLKSQLRLQMLRENMRETEWLHFIADFPEAADWFSTYWVPVDCKPVVPQPKKRRPAT